ncbi:M56 family metallopeptidase [Rhodococcus sp. NPDC049939]|uniref:M56 family metallopeptidase n=1 Tax=Rhodococcus sp. NPDC049939 TaxID=3155511 RepID=UPI0033E26ADD
MIVAFFLLLYSFVVAVLIPPLLIRLTHSGIAPGLGVAAWMAALGSVVLSWMAAATLVLVELVRDHGRPGQSALESCLASLHAVVSGRVGLVLQVTLLLLALMAVVAFATLIWKWSDRLRRMRSLTYGHARMTRMVGHHVAGVDAVVLEASQPAAYCVVGRPSAIVVTTAALGALDRRELDAVLAHERAHLAGRHLQVLAMIRGLASSLPWISLFTTAEAEVARLLEMCADDSAARTHGSHAVLSGLIAMSATSPLPSGAMGASGVAVLDRARRLAAPASPRDRMRARTSLAAASVLISIGPMATGLLAMSGVMLCGSMVM